MIFRKLIILETLEQFNILTEEKVSAFVKNVLNRYTDNFRGSRVYAAKYYSQKNPKDKMLYSDELKPLNKYKFRIKCIETFRKLNNTNLTEKEFENILDTYLLNYNKYGIII